MEYRECIACCRTGVFGFMTLWDQGVWDYDVTGSMCLASSDDVVGPRCLGLGDTGSKCLAL